MDPLTLAIYNLAIDYWTYPVVIILLLFIFLPSLLAVFAFKKLYSINLKMCLYYICLAAPIGMLLKLVTLFLAPILSLISIIINKNVLPYPLNLFHTHDQTLDAPDQGDGWPHPTSITGKFITRMRWMWRNPAYGFLHYVFGIEVSPGTTFVVLQQGQFLGPGDLNLTYNNAGISARGKVGIFAVWLGWKIIRNDKDNRRMLALGVKLYK